jgi:hypothetical protein
MKKSIALFATVSLLSVSFCSFAFAETNAGKMMKPETTKMEMSSSTKKMEGGKDAMMAKPKTVKHTTTIKKPVVTMTKKMDDKKMSGSNTTAH